MNMNKTCCLPNGKGICGSANATACDRCAMAMDRRHFLRTTLGLGAGLLAGRPWTPVAGADSPTQPRHPQATIYVVYVGGAGAWPKPEFDAAAEKTKFERHLREVERNFPEVRFVGGELTDSSAKVVEQVKARPEVCGILCFHLGMRDITSIVNAGQPVVVFSQPFSGHEWMLVSQLQQQGKAVALFSTRDPGEIGTAVSLLKAVGQMRQSKILLAADRAGKRAQDIKTNVGCAIQEITTEELIAAHQAVPEELARAEAEERWLKAARRIVEPNRAEIIKSARMYWAMKQLLAANQAQAIAVNCLGGIPIQTLGYPCLGFAQLCDEGLVGACEADLDSTLTMLLFSYAFKKPGFITDPLFDLSRNAVIHAHCVSPTRMDGPGTARAPFSIRTHRDDNRGASLEVDLRVGQAITCARFMDDEALLFSTGKIIEGKQAEFDDRGCRTQITVEVNGSAQKMLEDWSSAMRKYRDLRTLLHRVVFYGDHTRQVKHLARLMGLKVIAEC